jgi:hypothetical protein
MENTACPLHFTKQIGHSRTSGRNPGDKNKTHPTAVMSALEIMHRQSMSWKINDELTTTKSGP